jgi:transcriptional regulator with XRE-family HTH domain
MTLTDYLHKKRISYAEYARMIGVSSETVRRYCIGARLPTRAIIEYIYNETAGRVTPNDFFSLPKKIRVDGVDQ